MSSTVDVDAPLGEPPPEPRSRRRPRRRSRAAGSDSQSVDGGESVMSETSSMSTDSVRYRGGKPPDPPVYSGEVSKDNAQDPFGWKLFKQKVRVYERRAKPYLPKAEQALAIYQALEGRAAEQLQDLDLDMTKVLRHFCPYWKVLDLS